MKSYTGLEQSKRLAEILPLESADMCFNTRNNMPPLMTPYSKFNEFFGMEKTPDFLIPCWSLAALLEKLPYEVVDEEGTSRFFELYRGYMDKYYISYTGADEDIEGDYYDELVDACYEMIIRLNELKML